MSNTPKLSRIVLKQRRFESARGSKTSDSPKVRLAELDLPEVRSRINAQGGEKFRFDPFSYPPCSPSCMIFFLSVSQIDYPVSRTDYTTDDSSRIDSNRVDSTTFSTLPVRLLVWFFLSVLQIDYPVSRIDYTTDDSSRIDSNRVDSTTFSTLPVRLLL